MELVASCQRALCCQALRYPVPFHCLAGEGERDPAGALALFQELHFHGKAGGRWALLARRTPPLREAVLAQTAPDVRMIRGFTRLIEGGSGKLLSWRGLIGLEPCAARRRLAGRAASFTRRRWVRAHHPFV